MQKDWRPEDHWEEGGQAERDPHCMSAPKTLQQCPVKYKESVLSFTLLICQILDEEITPTMQKLLEVCWPTQYTHKLNASVLKSWLKKWWLLIWVAYFFIFFSSICTIFFPPLIRGSRHRGSSFSKAAQTSISPSSFSSLFSMSCALPLRSFLNLCIHFFAFFQTIWLQPWCIVVNFLTQICAKSLNNCIDLIDKMHEPRRSDRLTWSTRN